MDQRSHFTDYVSQWKSTRHHWQLKTASLLCVNGFISHFRILSYIPLAFRICYGNGSCDYRLDPPVAYDESYTNVGGRHVYESSYCHLGKLTSYRVFLPIFTKTTEFVWNLLSALLCSWSKKIVPIFGNVIRNGTNNCDIPQTVWSGKPTLEFGFDSSKKIFNKICLFSDSYIDFFSGIYLKIHVPNLFVLLL